jgi:hypothetical protein
LERIAWARRLKKRATGSGWAVVASMLLCNSWGCTKGLAD